MIRIENLYKSFNDNHVLRGIELEIFDGETITIIGGSGCGKTVLLKHIIGLLKPDRGKVYVDDTDIAELNEQELNEVQKKFGYLFQSCALFDSLTAAENVGFGLRNMNLSEAVIRRKVHDCLSHVGLADIEDIKPAELSGGMKKRVALARAIARDPKYILYDEPTTGLDPIFADAINDLIIHLQKTLKITSIVVTHDLKSAYKVSDRIAMLYEGKIIEIGRPEEIKSTKNPYVEQFIKGSSEGPIKLKLKEF
ncbi:MAG: ABC transporter ATP-binding protein [Elusimicrobiota bacterium]|nr:ABC transporter ATP-binding protein [Elusimicrobiota bacterium]